MCLSAQLEEVQQNAKDLENTASQLQKSLEEGCALMKEKDVKIEMQADREKELIACVHRYTTCSHSGAYTHFNFNFAITNTSVFLKCFSFQTYSQPKMKHRRNISVSDDEHAGESSAVCPLSSL